VEKTKTGEKQNKNPKPFKNTCAEINHVNHLNDTNAKKQALQMIAANYGM